MSSSDLFAFDRLTPAMDVERAVAELRFGRPVLVREGARHLAVLALDCVAPGLYDRFADVVGMEHSLLLTAPRALSLGIGEGRDVTTPLRGLSFEDASTLAYALQPEPPTIWQAADPLLALSAELARIALLLPAMVAAEITGRERLFAVCHCLDAAHLKGAQPSRQHFEIVARTPVPLKDLGMADFVVFRGGLAQKDQVAIVVGKPDAGKPVPVRIHSSCLTGDLCGSLKCDCGDQLRNGLKLLHQAGGGVLLYLDQEGRGTGIGAKMRAYGYQNEGLDTIDADAELGLKADHRRYEAAVAMLGLLGIESVVVYTNNPTKIAALRAGGIAVDARNPVTGRVTAENADYLRTKTLRAGHMMDLQSLRRTQ